MFIHVLLSCTVFFCSSVCDFDFDDAFCLPFLADAFESVSSSSVTFLAAAMVAAYSGQIKDTSETPFTSACFLNTISDDMALDNRLNGMFAPAASVAFTL